MSRSRSRKYASLITLVAAATVLGAASAGAAPRTSSHPAPAVHTGAGQIHAHLPAGVPKHGSTAFLLVLRAESTGDAYAAASAKGASAAKSAARAQLAVARSAQSAAIAHLPSKTSVLYRTHAASTAVAVYSNVKNYGALRAIPGVAAVYPISPKRPNLTYSIPLERAPEGWQAYGDLGANERIAVIDTGVDYTHANFGGPGTVAAYNYALKHDTEPVKPWLYDHAKFDATVGSGGTPVGMYDFAGDDYNPGGGVTTPQPDPNPLDCNSHGSHVAGIAAGYGENADGSTYAGPYDATTPFSTMRIGPGMAPHARVYAYKVFGCNGDTQVAGEAIDKAMDPNGDGDTSDHVDVINMSLGGDYASPHDGDAFLTNRASRLGVLVATSSGNGNDLFDITGSPGSAVRAITAANSTDGYQLADSLHVSAPDAIAGTFPSERSVAYDWAHDPDLSGQVVQVTQPGNLDGCLPFSADQAAAVAGKIAFVEWTDDNDNRRCGSAGRAANIAAAGASGFIYADDSEMFSAGITGSAVIPGVLVAKSGGDAIRAQLVAGSTVTISGTTPTDFKEIDPSYDDTMINTGSSRGIGDYGNVKPDVAAVGTSVFSTGMGTGNQGLEDSGTSMAAPMVAGEAALVRSMHPDWTPEQVKADIMNTADADLSLQPNHQGPKYAPQRVGSGRIDVKAALDNRVLAYDAAGTGSVSSSFGPIAVTSTSPMLLHRTIKVQNTGDTATSFTVSYVARTRIPGVSYSVSPTSMNLDARSSTTVRVTLRIVRDQLTKTLDPTMHRFEQGFPRQFQADASGLVVFRNKSESLRVPVYAAPRPASAMTQDSPVTMSGGKVQLGTLQLKGLGVDQGSGRTRVRSLVAGFELAARSAKAPDCSATITTGCVNFQDERQADLRYIGTTSDAPQVASLGGDPVANGMVYFAVSTWGRWRTPVGTQSYEIWIDTNHDGVADLESFTARIPAATTGSDVFIDETVDLNTGQVVDAEPLNASFGNTDTAIFTSNVLVMPIAIGAFPGLSEGHSRFDYVVRTFTGYEQTPLDSVGFVDGDTGAMSDALSFDALNPGVAVYGDLSAGSSTLLFADQPGNTLTVRRDRAAYSADHGRGALIVHFQNRLGQKSQPVVLTTAS